MTELNGYKLSARAAMAARGERAVPPRQALSIRHDAAALARVNPMAMDAAASFRPYEFAPEILPDGMAMDSCQPPNVGAINAWAVQSALHEAQAFLGFPYLAQLQQRAEYRHACEIWAEHAVRKWIKIIGGTQAKRDEVEKRLDELNVRDTFQKWMTQDHTYGRGQIFLDFGDADDYAEVQTPLTLDKAKIGKKRPLQHITTVEPMWSAPGTYSTINPLRPDFYRPQHWFIYGRQVHTSRLLTITSRPVSDMLKPNYAFGGLSLTQLMIPYVENWLRARQSVSDMLNSFSVMNLKTDMSVVLSGGGADDLFRRADMFTQARDNRGLMLTDKDNEELANIAVPLSGLADLQSQTQEQLASVSRIPLSIYLQITPTGLNATSDGETRNFYADVHAYQEKNVRPDLQTVLNIVQLSLFDEIDPDIKFEFVPLWEMSDDDKARIRKSDADADVGYVNAGIIDPEEVRERLSNDETSLYHGVDLSDPPPGHGNEGVDEGPDDDGPQPKGAQDEWRESDHPRDEDGKFGSGGRRFDPGELNIPGRLKNVDRDVSKAVAFVENLKKEQFKNARDRQRAHEAATREFLADPSVDTFLKAKAKKMSVSISTLRSTVKSMSAPMFAKFVESYERENEPKGAQDEATIQAASILICAKDGRALFLKRAQDDSHSGNWSFPGGRIDDGETPEQAAVREVREETGYAIEAGDLGPSVANYGGHVIYYYEVDEPFGVDLEDKHDGLVWAKPNEAPSPLNDRAADTLADFYGVAMDEKTAYAAGILFTTPSGRVLLMKRAKSAEHKGLHWGLPGGHIEPGETPEQTAAREAMEETGYSVDPDALGEPISTINGFACYQYECPSPFKPDLNHEHDSAGWFLPGDMPRPLHPGVDETIRLVYGANV